MRTTKTHTNFFTSNPQQNQPHLSLSLSLSLSHTHTHKTIKLGGCCRSAYKQLGCKIFNELWFADLQTFFIFITTTTTTTTKQPNHPKKSCNQRCRLDHNGCTTTTRTTKNKTHQILHHPLDT